MAIYNGLQDLTNPLNGTTIDAPFARLSDKYYPKTVSEVFSWADYMWGDGVYKQALSKCVRYFLTDLEVFGTAERSKVSYETRRKYEEHLRDCYRILEELAIIGDDYVGWGNSFTSLSRSIKRNLMCPKCKFIAPLKEGKYQFSDFKFVTTCVNPECHHHGTFQHIDVPDIKTNQPLKIIRWEPKDILIANCSITGNTRYYLKISEEVKTCITRGDFIYMESIPWEIVEAVRTGKYFEFDDPSTFKHLKCAVPAAFQNVTKGWGLPLFMSQFDQAVRLQMLHRYNEAIVSDYLLPFRVITPSPNGSMDPIKGMVLGDFKMIVSNMIKEHRKDPATWHFLPSPIQYQAISGEGAQMAPIALIDRALDDLLTAIGVPQEFYRNSIASIGATPVGLRLFEKVWSHYTTALDDWLNWFTDTLASIKSWEDVTVKLVKTSIYEDDQQRQLKTNLCSAGQISKHTAFRTLGINPDYERARMLDEQAQDMKANNEMQMKLQESDMLMGQLKTPPPQLPQDPAQQGAPQDPAAQGAPQGQPQMSGGGGNGAIVSIDDLFAQAQSMAQSLFQDPNRASRLIQLGKDNKALHGQVKAELEKMDSQARSQGLAQAKQGQG